MLSAFLESGNTLSALSASQMHTLKRAFMLYLLQAVKFNDAMKLCYKILDEDQDHLRVVIKAKLAEMIENPDCNLIYKPAILRLAMGDPSVFKSMGVSTAATKNIIARDWHIIKPQLTKIKYPITELGLKHIESLENEQIPLVEKHAMFYVMRYSRFLTQGDSGLTIEDMTKDLVVVALRAMRWYYPYISKLHLTNIMRRSITNRGRGMITYNVVESRRRVFTDEDGRTINRESVAAFASASDWIGFSEDPTSGMNMKLVLEDLSRNNPVVKKLSSFILSDKIQDEFLSWLEKRYGIKEDTIPTAVTKSGKSYAYLLANFLQIDKDEVKKALLQIRAAA